MAIFEKKIERKVTIDDTEQIRVIIETAQKVKGHTEYVLRVQRGPTKENSWKILRRYNDFVELNKCLQNAGIRLPLPGKKFIGNMRPEFIAERRRALQLYIKTILMNPILASSLPTKKFIDPDSYSSPFHDQALQNASLCLRTEGFYTIGQTMGAIGWRLRKHYFQVLQKPSGQSGNKHLVKSSSQCQSKQQSNNASTGSDNVSHSDELVLTWIEYGPDRYLDDKDINCILKSLTEIRHPYIEPLLYVANNETGALVIRKFYKCGSLKDILCMATPKNPFLAKYGSPKGRTVLTLKQTATYGRQILQALRFLHSKGIPFGHLHSGNIMIIGDTVRLFDIENFVLGVPAFYRPFYVQHSKLHSSETIDVYCFGHVLFEMSMGYPLQESVARQITDCPESLKNLLESILSKEACKVGLPTLDQLMEHTFFTEHCSNLESDSSIDDLSKAYLKLSMNEKEQIKNLIHKTEVRLRDEQKSVKNQKRLVRVQELMSSEEEKRKSKQRAKQEHKQSKLKQQNSLHMQRSTCSSWQLNKSDSVASVSASPDTISTASASLTNSQSQLQNVPSQDISQILSSPKTTESPTECEGERNALLESICRFNRGSLRKVRSND